MSFEKALQDIVAGKPILVYDFDDRERESDLTIASQFVTPDVIRMMRKEAGGLICTTMPGMLAEEIGLPFMSDVFQDDAEKYPVLRMMSPTDIPYDHTRSSFGITINHRDTYTGITDSDRALTIRRFAEVVFEYESAEEIREQLGKEFRTPGHVHLLNTTNNILKDRKGHTELCTAMMAIAGVYPSATICEMMDDNGGSMCKEKVLEYAKSHDIQVVTGDQVIEEWNKFLEKCDEVLNE